MGGIAIGGFFLTFAVLILVVLLGMADPGLKFAVPVLFSLIGGGLIAGNVLALPGWAREQERRMEHICRHAVSLLALPESKDD